MPKFVFDFFLERTFAPALEEVAEGIERPLPDALAALRRLDETHQPKPIDGTARILMAFPFSAVSTPYRVTRENRRRYFANCAWDAVAFHPMLEEPVRIDAFCHHCGRPLDFRVEGGRGVAEGGGSVPLVRLGQPAAEWWRDIGRTCHHTMVFFEPDDHVDQWEAAEKPSAGARLSIEQVVRMSVPIYGAKMRLEYARPSVEALRAHYRGLRLTGPFWAL